MKNPYPARKWMALFGLLLLATLSAQATRESAVTNSSPESGTSKIVVRNRTSMQLNATVGDQVAYNFPKGTERVFENAQLFKRPYPIKIDFSVGYLKGESLEFKNSQGASPYTTDEKTFQIPYKELNTGGTSYILFTLYAEYEWVAGYWLVTIHLKEPGAP